MSWKIQYRSKLNNIAATGAILLATSILASAQNYYDPDMVARQEKGARDNGLEFYRPSKIGIGPNDIGLVLREVNPPDRIFVHARIEEIRNNAIISDSLQIGDEIAVIDKLVFRSFSDMAEYVSNRRTSSVLNLLILRPSPTEKYTAFGATAQVKVSYTGPEREREAIEALQGILGSPGNKSNDKDRERCTWSWGAASTMGIRHCSRWY